MKVGINKERIHYLLALYRMSEESLLSILNEGRKRKIQKDNIFCNAIDLPLLKKVDKIFDKGLDFYTDFSPLTTSKSDSILFRKSKFGIKLNNESIRTVHRFETLKQTIDAYNKLSKLNIQPNIAHYSIKDNPIEIAHIARNYFYPGNIKDTKKFLVAMINKCAEHNVFVFEYIESWNKKEKTNIDGFYLKPNMIVLKRHKHYKREIFTFAHELGHYMLGKEEVEQVDIVNIDTENRQNVVEKWCNDFAYYFIMGEAAKKLEIISKVNADNDYYMDYIANISNQTHISKLAIFTRLYIDKKMTFNQYDIIKNNLIQEYQERKEKEKSQKEKRFGTPPNPILSPLFLKSMQYAYFKGIVNEMTFCKRLNIKPENFEKTLWQ